MNSGRITMMEYNLPKYVEGKELISTLKEAGEFFNYSVDIRPLKETNSNLGTLWWRIFGTHSSENFRYNGLPLRKVDPKIKSVEVCKEEQTPKRIGNSWQYVWVSLWTAEAILDEEKMYDIFPIEIYKGDGLVRRKSRKSIYVARAKPLKANKEMLVVKPAVDGLAGKVKEILSK